MICVVVAYLAIEKEWVTRDEKRYYWINFIGAILLTLSFIIHFDLGGFLIEMFWIGISIAGIIRINRDKRD